MPQYPEIVKQIHDEFKIAGERLVSDAKCILEHSKQSDYTKGDLLMKVGFFNTPEAQQLEDARKREVDDRDLAEVVEYYKFKYPNQKFITDDIVEKICNKYNLVCAGISRFKGFVPKPKLTNIAAFKVDTVDVAGSEFIINGARSNDREWEKRVYKLYPSKIIPAKLLVGSSHTKKLNIPGQTVWITDVSFIGNPNELLICAPRKEMNLKGLKKISNNMYASLFRAHYPDPVVLQPVYRGKLIVEAWGDEASDEMVVNEKMN